MRLKSLFLTAALTTLALPVFAQSQDPASGSAPAPSPKPPRPKMMYALDLKKDTAKWTVGGRVSHPKVIVMELVPEGQSETEWKEMLTNMVAFGLSLGDYVQRWERELRVSAPTISLKDEGLPDGSVLVRYRTADESGFWRFAQGEDGIYAMAYQSKLEGQDAGRLGLWEGLVRDTKLVPNVRR